MPKFLPNIFTSQTGFAQILVLAILLTGIAGGVYLVSQRTSYLPQAAVPKKTAELKLPSNSSATDFPFCSSQSSFDDLYEKIPEPGKNFPVKCSVDKKEAKVGEDVTWSAEVTDSTTGRFTVDWLGEYPIYVGKNNQTTPDKVFKKTVKYQSNGYKYGRVIIRQGPSKSGSIVCEGSVKVTGQPEPSADGLRAHYYNGGCGGRADLVGGSARRVGGVSSTGDPGKALYPVDPQVNFNWGSSAPKEGILPCFSVNWAGYIVPPETGEYIFSVSVNDAARLWVDYKLIFNAWEKRDQEAEVTGTPIRLEASKRYDILLNYYNYQNNASIKLYWKKPNQQDKEIVPQQYLYSNNLSYCQMPQ